MRSMEVDVRVLRALRTEVPCAGMSRVCISTAPGVPLSSYSRNTRSTACVRAVSCQSAVIGFRQMVSPAAPHARSLSGRCFCRWCAT
jgi:hypothetical protein